MIITEIPLVGSQYNKFLYDISNNFHTMFKGKGKYVDKDIYRIESIVLSRSQIFQSLEISYTSSRNTLVKIFADGNTYGSYRYVLKKIDTDGYERLVSKPNMKELNKMLHNLISTLYQYKI